MGQCIQTRFLKCQVLQKHMNLWQALFISRGLKTFIMKNILVSWRINFFKKVRYSIELKQGNDIHDLKNTCEGINDGLPAPVRNLRALRRRSSVSPIGWEACKLLLYTNITVPFKQLTPNPLIKMSSNDLQRVNTEKKMLIFIYLSICANPLTMDSNALLQNTARSLPFFHATSCFLWALTWIYLRALLPIHLPHTSDPLGHSLCPGLPFFSPCPPNFHPIHLSKSSWETIFKLSWLSS